MKKAVIFLILAFCFFIFSRDNFACSYIQTDVKLSIDEVRKYYLEEFKGAILIGKVLSVKDISIQESVGTAFVKETVVEVEKYWTGVEKSQIKVYTGAHKDDCDYTDFKAGEIYFLNAFKRGNLLWVNNSEKIDSIKKFEKGRMFSVKYSEDPKHSK